MNKYEILRRLREAKDNRISARLLKEEFRRKPLNEQREIINHLREERTKSDNSDIIDVINDVLNDLDRDE